MRHRARAATALLLASACVQRPTIPRFGSEDLDLTVRVSLRELQPGDVDTITVIARNRTAALLRVVFPTTCQMQVFIRNAGGRTVLPEGGGYDCVPVPSLLNIAAGDSVVQLFLWDGRTAFLPASSAVRLPAGSYYAAATLDADGLTARALGPVIQLFDPE